MNPTIRYLGLADYRATWEAMRAFTDTRAALTGDELWFLEHHPVFTLGLAGKREHLLDPGAIPVIHCDRGGQVTYHGPGQLVVYVLLDLKRLGWGVQSLVRALEQGVIDALQAQGVGAVRRIGAPGVYVSGSKIAALGLRVRRGCAYHGLALNVDLDLGPFGRINPCGYPGLGVTRTVDHGVPGGVTDLGATLLPHLLDNLGCEGLRLGFARGTGDENECRAH